jgi:hypothetical protein
MAAARGPRWPGLGSGPGWACGYLLAVPWGAWLALLSANRRPLAPWVRLGWRQVPGPDGCGLNR